MSKADNPKAVAGDNSAEVAHKFAKDQLKSIIERIERLEDERDTIGQDVKDVYAEAKGNGFSTKALRTIIRLRKMDSGTRQEDETILHTYMHALGMDVFS